jgi:hypothetical protein
VNIQEAEQPPFARATDLVGLLGGGRGVLLDSLGDVVDSLLDGVGDGARVGSVGGRGPAKRGQATWKSPSAVSTQETRARRVMKTGRVESEHQLTL